MQNSQAAVIVWTKLIRRSMISITLRCLPVNCTKLISLITIACFIQSIIAPVAEALVTVQPATALSAIPRERTLIPSTEGRFTSGRYFGSDTVVINIQDLHGHAEVQHTISSILGRLDKQYGLTTVLVEGGYGDIDTSLLDNISTPDRKKEIVEAMLTQGTLTGAEAYAITNKRPGLLKGLDDEQLHKGNIRRLGMMLDKKPIFEKSVKKLDRDIAFLEAKYCTSRNERFNRIIDRYHAGGISSQKFYVLLEKYVRKINAHPERFNVDFKIDMARYPNMNAYIELQRISKTLAHPRIKQQLQSFMGELKKTLSYSAYNDVLAQTGNFSETDKLFIVLSRIVREQRIALDRNYPDLDRFLTYIEKSQSLNPVSMTFEEKRLIEEIRVALSRDISELEVTFSADFYQYFKDYLFNRLAADDYAYFNERFDTFKQIWTKYTYVDHLSDLSTEFPLLDEYYKVNEQRNDVFLKHILAQTSRTVPAPASSDVSAAAALSMEDAIERVLASLDETGGAAPRRNLIVIVAGGFHTAGLEQLLDRQKISHVSITPHITQETATASAMYKALITQQAKELAATPRAVPGPLSRLPGLLKPVSSSTQDLAKNVLNVDFKHSDALSATIAASRTRNEQLTAAVSSMLAVAAGGGGGGGIINNDNLPGMTWDQIREMMSEILNSMGYPDAVVETANNAWTIKLNDKDVQQITIQGNEAEVALTNGKVIRDAASVAGDQLLKHWLVLAQACMTLTSPATPLNIVALLSNELARANMISGDGLTIESPEILQAIENIFGIEPETLGQMLPQLQGIFNRVANNHIDLDETAKGAPALQQAALAVTVIRDFLDLMHREQPREASGSQTGSAVMETPASPLTTPSSYYLGARFIVFFGKIIHNIPWLKKWREKIVPKSILDDATRYLEYYDLSNVSKGLKGMPRDAFDVKALKNGNKIILGDSHQMLLPETRRWIEQGPASFLLLWDVPRHVVLATREYMANRKKNGDKTVAQNKANLRRIAGGLAIIAVTLVFGSAAFLLWEQLDIVWRIAAVVITYLVYGGSHRIYNKLFGTGTSANAPLTIGDDTGKSTSADELLQQLLSAGGFQEETKETTIANGNLSSKLNGLIASFVLNRPALGLPVGTFHQQVGMNQQLAGMYAIEKETFEGLRKYASATTDGQKQQRDFMIQQVIDKSDALEKAARASGAGEDVIVKLLEKKKEIISKIEKPTPADIKLAVIFRLLTSWISKLKDTKSEYFRVHLARDGGFFHLIENALEQHSEKDAGSDVYHLSRARMTGVVYTAMVNIMKASVVYAEENNIDIYTSVRIHFLKIYNDPNQRDFRVVVDAVRKELVLLGYTRKDKLLFVDTGFFGTIPFFLKNVVDLEKSTDQLKDESGEENVQVALVQPTFIQGFAHNLFGFELSEFNGVEKLMLEAFSREQGINNSLGEHLEGIKAHPIAFNDDNMIVKTDPATQLEVFYEQLMAAMMVIDFDSNRRMLDEIATRQLLKYDFNIYVKLIMDEYFEKSAVPARIEALLQSGDKRMNNIFPQIEPSMMATEDMVFPLKGSNISAIIQVDKLSLYKDAFTEKKNAPEISTLNPRIPAFVRAILLPWWRLARLIQSVQDMIIKRLFQTKKAHGEVPPGAAGTTVENTTRMIADVAGGDTVERARWSVAFREIWANVFRLKTFKSEHLVVDPQLSSAMNSWRAAFWHGVAAVLGVFGIGFGVSVLGLIAFNPIVGTMLAFAALPAAITAGTLFSASKHVAYNRDAVLPTIVWVDRPGGDIPDDANIVITTVKPAGVDLSPAGIADVEAGIDNGRLILVVSESDLRKKIEEIRELLEGNGTVSGSSNFRGVLERISKGTLNARVLMLAPGKDGQTDMIWGGDTDTWQNSIPFNAQSAINVMLGRSFARPPEYAFDVPALTEDSRKVFEGEESLGCSFMLPIDNLESVAATSARRKGSRLFTRANSNEMDNNTSNCWDANGIILSGEMPSARLNALLEKLHYPDAWIAVEGLSQAIHNNRVRPAITIRSDKDEIPHYAVVTIGEDITDINVLQKIAQKIRTSEGCIVIFKSSQYERLARAPSARWGIVGQSKRILDLFNISDDTPQFARNLAMRLPMTAVDAAFFSTVKDGDLQAMLNVVQGEGQILEQYPPFVAAARVCCQNMTDVNNKKAFINALKARTLIAVNGEAAILVSPSMEQLILSIVNPTDEQGNVVSDDANPITIEGLRTAMLGFSGYTPDEARKSITEAATVENLARLIISAERRMQLLTIERTTISDTRAVARILEAA